MLGFTHFFNNDDNKYLNSIIEAHGTHGYAFYYALIESACSAIDKDKDIKAVTLYRATILRRSGLSPRKLNVIVNWVALEETWSALRVTSDALRVTLSEVSIAKLPEIIAFHDYKISKVKATKYNIKKDKADTAGAHADAPSFLGLTADVLTMKFREEFGNEFIDTHLQNACDYFDDKVRKGNKEKWVYESLLRSEKKFGCPYKASNKLSNFSWDE